ncbi:DNA polymerase III subunit gamma/tau [Thalassotalea eurytherma]|uniref:DNA polymerase III subunit gamma/tau n=1 Tax=Thalassotalea eurytherma TaxID=1144278 RepID=A0ABQ6H6Z5_9GAMM|nr:DNA polymerase III subunit gamma/tau [Thalassotalea eurytherma]GLX83239.1 DNA polymerase III subunit gamma/tau [Thalassotalea eurytherma]
MSYQVLARKWRPKDFSELMGQEHVVNVLYNALDQERLHHAYLFTGTRGVGKTTIARIFAKSLNCEQGISANPCGKCDTCLDIDSGRYIDLLEIDAASKTKVDDTREILDNVQYAPSRGRFKVYLIDEVHMLSRSSFNALLKTLEEPPEHVKFILATTDPQKLPITVLSRCLQFHLKALTVEQIKKQLTHILAAENVSVEPMALTILAKAARGSMRDCLSLTDQAIAQGRGNISFANVQEMLGGVDHQWAFNILTCLIKQDGQALMALSQEIATYAPNYSQVMAQLIQLLHQIALAQVVGNHFDYTDEQQELFDKFCRLMSPEDVQLYYQISVQGRKDLPLSIDEQAGFDMVLLRMLAFQPMARPVSSAENLARSDEKTGEVDSLTVLPTNVSTSKPVAPNAIEPNAEVNTPIVDVPESLPLVEEASGELSANEQSLTIEEPSTNVENLVSEQQEILSQAAQQGFSESVDHAQQAVFEDPRQVDALNTQLNNEEQSQPVEPSLPNQSTIVDNEPNVFEASIQSAPESVQYEPEPLATQQNTPQVEQGNLSAVTTEILATRNMLRSRKKGLDKPEKKPDDAIERPVIPAANTTNDLPDESELPDQPYKPDIIDPAKIKKANQVDKWAFMIDAMGLNGRIRQLAINAVISEKSDDDNLYLELDQNTKHLQSEKAHEQLQSFISQYLKKPVTVHIEVIGQTQTAPFNIQTDINEKRLDYAKELITSDEVVHRLQNEFQAQLDEASIQAR